MEQVQTIELGEEENCFLGRHAFTSAEAQDVYERYGKIFEVDFPSPINEHRYRLRSQGYVGSYPLCSGRFLRVSSKVPVDSVLRMLEYAYDLGTFKLYDGIIGSASNEDIFENLANILAKRITERARRGLRKDYVERHDELPFVRGRILIRESLRASLGGPPRIACEFDHHTPELEDNHILAYTLARLTRFAYQREDVGASIARAARMMAMSVDTQEVDAKSCVARFYDRMNFDYQPMHALCRFFLEQCGPADEAGIRDMIPFSLYMPTLFESFVARWLKENLDARFLLQSQFHAAVDGSDGLYFNIDLVLRDRMSGEAIAVLDTKYKRGSKPKIDDVQQIVAYAARMQTTTAALIFPTAIPYSHFSVGDIQVHILGFDLSQSIGSAGRDFLATLNSLTSGADPDVSLGD